MFKVSQLTKTQKLTISALCMAVYVVIMIFTQSFAFGQYQIRVATALYGLSAIFPFLVVPLGLSNFISNTIMGGLGPLDMIGGTIVGILTSLAIVLIKRNKLPNIFITFAIILIPGLCVPIWLSYLFKIPYMILAPSLLVGQVIPGILGAVLVSALEPKVSKNIVLSK